MHYPTITWCANLKQPKYRYFWHRFQFWNFTGRLPGILTELFHLPNFQAAYTSTICTQCQKISGVQHYCFQNCSGFSSQTQNIWSKKQTLLVVYHLTPIVFEAQQIKGYWSYLLTTHIIRKPNDCSFIGYHRLAYNLQMSTLRQRLIVKIDFGWSILGVLTLTTHSSKLK